MKIKRIDNFVAECEVRGLRRRVSLFMLPSEALAPAILRWCTWDTIQRVSEEEAVSAWETYDEMVALTAEIMEQAGGA